MIVEAETEKVSCEHLRREARFEPVSGYWQEGTIRPDTRDDERRRDEEKSAKILAVLSRGRL